MTRPVAGIAMGLIKEGDDYVILTDIQGAEDHLGDMDFKVAGTRHGVTALQMDIKITGVTQEIMRTALSQAKRGPRVHPRPDGRDARRSRARSSPRTRRGSRRSRSTPSRSASSSARAARRSARSRPTTTCRSTSRRTARPHLRDRGHEGGGGHLGDQGADEGAGGRRHVHRQGRPDDRLRGLRRAEEGHRRAAARLERRPGPARAHRGRASPAATCWT